MYDIRIFLCGFFLWYIIQVMDIALQLMTSYVSIIVTEHQVIISQYQKQIQDIVGDKEMQERTPAIGFMANFDDDFDDD